MELIIDNSSILDSVREMSKELQIDKDLNGLKEQFGKIVTNTVDKIATYTIKAMPIPDGFKDVLSDVKNAFKTRDFKEIIQTAVNSSVREGMELLGLDKASIKSLKELKDIAKEGGLAYGIKAGIEIVAKKYLKNNIVGDFVYDFFDKIKDSPLNNSFLRKIEDGIEKATEVKERFLDKCNEFKKAYENFDMDKITKLAEELEHSVKNVKFDGQCIRENKTIQNIFTLVNNKKEKLTDAQLQLCNMM